MPKGFIPLPPCVEPWAAFRPLPDDLRRTLVRPPSERTLHSAYLHGSVARDKANAGRSDLDLTLVPRDPPSLELVAQLETARLVLQARRPEVSRIGFDIGHLDQVRDPANRDSWGYQLKRHCRCLWGKDLTNALPSLRPVKAIVLVLNGDCVQVLEDYARRLESAPSEEECRRLQWETARKLIRFSDIPCREMESAWSETLEYYLVLFRVRHPGQAPVPEYFRAVLDGQVIDSAAFIECLRVFSAWMQRQTQPAETVILSAGPAGPWRLAPCACTRAPG